jgi:DNA-binding Lrp family transcriptional regulator
MLTRNEVKARLKKLVADKTFEDVRLVVDSFGQWTIQREVGILLRSATLQEVQDILDEIEQEAA